MESLKQLVAIYKEIDVRMHAIYANVIHHRSIWMRLNPR
jgi:hypothetical protein